MTIARITIALVLCGGLTLGQDRTASTGSRVPPLQEELGLTEEQYGQLRANAVALHDEMRPLLQDLNDTRRSLSEELRAEFPDEDIVGQLTVEVEQLWRQIQEVQADYRASARELLTPEQMDALAPIEAAADLIDLVRAAAAMNLVDAPVGNGPRNRYRIQRSKR